MVRVTEENVLGCLGEIELVEVFAHGPFPNDVAFPVYFDDGVIQKTLIANALVVKVRVAKDKGVAAIGLAFHAWHIVAYWIAFALVVVVLTCHPAWFMAFVLDVVFVVKLPHNVAVPVELSKVGLVLIGKGAITNTQATHNIAAWEKLIWEALEVLPNFYNITIHVN